MAVPKGLIKTNYLILCKKKNGRVYAHLIIFNEMDRISRMLFISPVFRLINVHCYCRGSCTTCNSGERKR